ncbi:hypothetical protein GIB67_031256, partial [Kingdonia uniflora]
QFASLKCQIKALEVWVVNHVCCLRFLRINFNLMAEIILEREVVGVGEESFFTSNQL